MIFEVVNEITALELIITGILVIVFIITMLHMWINLNRKDKIHKSYHKGYNKAKSDKVQYYKTIKKLIDSFTRILFELEKDNIKPSIITTQLLIDFKESLQDYYNN